MEYDLKSLNYGAHIQSKEKTIQRKREINKRVKRVKEGPGAK